MGVRNHKYDLAICTPTFFGRYVHVDTEEKVEFRRTLFRSLVKSLDDTVWDGKRIAWCIWDDHSERPEQPVVNWGDVHFFQQPSGPSKSASDNVISCLNYAVRLAPLTITIDSDCIVNPQWLHRAYELVDEYPGAPCWGLYNTRYHPVIDYNGFTSDDPRTIFKHTNTILGTLFRSEDRGQVPITEGSWCEEFIGKLPFEVARIIPVTRPSMIQHCGHNGLNSVEGVTIPDFDPEFLP